MNSSVLLHSVVDGSYVNPAVKVNNLYKSMWSLRTNYLSYFYDDAFLIGNGYPIMFYVFEMSGFLVLIV
jgi:hypothetical protein